MNKDKDFPILKTDKENIGNNLDLLKFLYDQCASTWRQLVEVRFKLFGLFPAASLTVIILLLSKTENQLSNLDKTLIGVIGICMTLAIKIYDNRNSKIIAHLIKVGERIEEDLGIEIGQFKGRDKSSSKLLFFIPIRSSWIFGIIYSVLLISWVLIILSIWYPFFLSVFYPCGVLC